MRPTAAALAAAPFGAELLHTIGRCYSTWANRYIGDNTGLRIGGQLIAVRQRLGLAADTASLLVSAGKSAAAARGLMPPDTAGKGGTAALADAGSAPPPAGGVLSAAERAGEGDVADSWDGPDTDKLKAALPIFLETIVKFTGKDVATVLGTAFLLFLQDSALSCGPPQVLGRACDLVRTRASAAPPILDPPGLKHGRHNLRNLKACLLPD